MGRTFRDRWFTWPWRPWVKTWMYVPQIPDPHLYRLQDDLNGQCLVAHPETMRKIITLWEAKNNG